MSVCGLAGLVPRAGFAQVVLGAEHQRAGRAHGDAVAAVHAGGLGQRVGVLGGDAGVEAAPGHGDRERVLVLLAARLDALVAEDALGVVAHVEVVVDLGRLVHGGGGLRRRAARDGRCACGRARGRAAPAGRSARGARCSAAGTPAAAGVIERSTDEPEELEHHLAAVAHARRVGLDHHAASTLREHAGTSARAPSSSTTQTRHAFAGVRVSPKHSVGVSTPSVAGVEDRRALGHLDRLRRRSSAPPCAAGTLLRSSAARSCTSAR